MIRPLRAVFAALFLMSMFCMASCNRNWCDCFCSPCEVNCPPKCDPCQPCPPRFGPSSPSCDPCQPSLSCDPCITPCSSQWNEPNSCAPCGQSSGVEANPYFPCDTSAVACGGGNCDQIPEERCYRNMRVARIRNCWSTLSYRDCHYSS